MQNVILIGGSPTAGKSYTTRLIAEELKLPWISTDNIRDLMRETVRKEDYPKLFEYDETTTEKWIKFLRNKSSKEVVRAVNEENEDVWKGIKALIETDYVWKSYIIEGAAILPKLVSKIAKRNKKINIIAIFLIDEDEERVRKTIFERGLWDEARNYPDEIKEKEVEWVKEFNEYTKREAKNYGFRVVSVGNRKDYISEIKKMIK